MGGFGRGAGNCPMELLLGFLRNPKFKLRPVVELLQHYIDPLRETTHWGPSLPYNITGQLNRHPDAAIKFLEGDDSKNYLRFYRRDRAGRLTGRPLPARILLIPFVSSYSVGGRDERNVAEWGGQQLSCRS